MRHQQNESADEVRTPHSLWDIPSTEVQSEDVAFLDCEENHALLHLQQALQRRG